MSLPTAVPPALVVLGLAAVVALVPRRVGGPIGVVGGVATAGWLLAVPAGAHLAAAPFGFEAALFAVDAYSRLLGAAIAFMAAIAVAFLQVTGANRLQTALALAYVSAGLGATFAGDWLTLVVAWELMAVAATALLWYGSRDRAVGVRYAVYHELGGLALLAGIALHYAGTGSFLFDGGLAAGWPAGLAAVGIGLNAGVVGLHVWLVDAYPRTHVATSVVLVAVTTKVGAYTFLRAFPDGLAALAYLGAAMVLFGVTMAILQSDVRRLLSYHIVSQIGYVVAGLGAGAALAQAGAMAHLVNNVLYKSLLFMVAGVLIQRTGRASLKKLGGLGGPMPALAVVYLVAAVSIAGIPGFNGFVSKGLVLDGVEAAGLTVVWWALLVGGVGTVISFAKFGDAAFLGDRTDASDLGRWEAAPLGVVAALCLLLGLRPGLLLGLLPAEAVVAAKPFAPKQFQKAGVVVSAGLVGYALLRKRLRTIEPVGDLDAVYHPVGERLRDGAIGSVGGLEDGLSRTGRTAVAAASRVSERWSAPLERRRSRWLTPIPSIGFGLLVLVIVTAAALLVLLG